jgi:hypothetical protein
MIRKPPPSLAAALEGTVEKMAVISTAHLSRRDMDILRDCDEQRFPLRIIPHEFGWIFSVYCGFHTDEAAELKRALKGYGLHQSFVHIFERLSALDYAWVNFDCDGTTIPDFVEYDHTIEDE